MQRGDYGSICFGFFVAGRLCRYAAGRGTKQRHTHRRRAKPYAPVPLGVQLQVSINLHAG